MAKRHGITIDILIEGEAQRIYDDPDPEGGISKPKESTFYVKAVTDALFSIMVMFGRGFKLRGAHGVGIHVSLDGKSMCYDYMSRKDLRESHNPHHRYRVINSVSLYDPETRKWRNASFSFGSLTVCSSMLTTWFIIESTDSDAEPPVTNNLGKIHIEIQRVYRYKRTGPRRPHQPYEFKAVLEVAEKDLKGQAIENTIKPVFGKSLKPPASSKHKYKPIEGPYGEELNINILYRSKKALQSLGCIPRTPLPTPGPEDEETSVSNPQGPKLESDQELESDREPDRDQTPERIRAIQAEFAAYNQSRKVKTEVDLTEPGASTKARIKRERNDDVEFLSHKRLRATASSASEVIDLTDD